MDIKIIDNFLPKEEFEELKGNIVFNATFPFYFQSYVSHDPRFQVDEKTNELWNWYATHSFYNYDKPESNYCPRIVEIFIPKFQEMGIYKSLMRIKANLYPHTDVIREHSQHDDYSFKHYAALYSLNTCDGFTRMSDGTKIDSVENRIFFFDGSEFHNSSTTTNVMARYNINFNFL
jgi:hypothetical protein